MVRKTVLRTIALVAAPLLILGITQRAAQAKYGKFTMTSGSGEEVVIKHGIFGNRETI